MGSKEVIVESQRKIISDLTQCEELIADLYRQYSTVMPELSPFWKDLAAKEKSHAKMLKSMHRQLDKGYVFRDIGRFDSTATAPFILMIKAAISEAEARSVSPRDAIQTALSIENSLLDAHFYDIVKSDAPEFQVIAKRLANDTQDHVEAVNKMMIDIRLSDS